MHRFVDQEANCHNYDLFSTYLTGHIAFDLQFQQAKLKNRTNNDKLKSLEMFLFM